MMTACFSQKDTILNRNIQNLSARYNILYNANELLNESEQNIRLAYKDNYDQLITVYQEPNDLLSEPENQRLDKVILKANKIINEKTRSNYMDDAYFLIAKANHFKSNFFNAISFFNYVYDHYKEYADLRQATLAWKARSLLELELFDEAQAVLDSALKKLDLKKASAADVCAARAQLHIYKQQNAAAIVLLSKALKWVRNRYYRIRWTYLLAQLQQSLEESDKAYINYSKVVRSNADFNMSFHANLNRISIDETKQDKHFNRITRLKKLLKDDKNSDLIDQIYFHIGKAYEGQKDMEKATKNYKIALQKGTNNQHQKGLSYLKLADIYFNSADYVQAKAYYDSTLASLSENYPDYEKIKKKSNNIELLADRLHIIAEQNKLQVLAQLPEQERNKQINLMLTAQHASSKYNPSSVANKNAEIVGHTVDEKFYFNNALALNQGLASFHQRWADRILEDDWRRSQKTTSNAVDTTAADSANKNIANNPGKADSSAIKQIDSFVATIPLTSEQCILSDQKIAAAYFDIADHYREIVNDPKQAIETYETLLTLYPKNNHSLPVYYNLYRLYEFKDDEKSAYYKNLILSGNPESIFARTILNLDDDQKNNELEDALNRFYDEMYCSYMDKQYKDVSYYNDWAQIQFGSNKLSPQLAYLNVLAIGHTHKLDAFEASLKKITTDFASDTLITPLVQKHLLFIKAHRISFANRPVALTEHNAAEFEFTEQTENDEIKPNKVAVLSKMEKKSDTTEKAEPNADLFSKEASDSYYFLICVKELNVNLSSSRFGIGQFNRIHFTNNAIKHQLKLLDNQNQLIFVGVFPNRNTAANYYKEISPLMPQIMKISTQKYHICYISKQNFDKIFNQKTFDWYMDFFKKNLYTPPVKNE